MGRWLCFALVHEINFEVPLLRIKKQCAGANRTCPYLWVFMTNPFHGYRLIHLR
jgi:hypothetical protein